MDELIHWLLEAGEPWTRYRTPVDLLDLPENDQDVRTARTAMLVEPQIQIIGKLADMTYPADMNTTPYGSSRISPGGRAAPLIKS